MSYQERAAHLHIGGQYFLNHLLEEDEVRRQVGEFAQAGYETLYIHSRAGLLTPYFSRQWFHMVDVIVEECRAHGMIASIWDEDYYPSPTAGGRVVWNNPQHAAQRLAFTVHHAKPGELVQLKLANDGAVMQCMALVNGTLEDITDCTGTVKYDWWGGRHIHSGYSHSTKICSPHIRAGLKERWPALLWQAPADSQATVIACQLVRNIPTHGVDLLNPDAIDSFLNITHEEYLRHHPKDFSEAFASSFMDEPNVGSSFPWTDRFAEEFQADHGFGLTPLLAHLAIDIDERTPFIRNCYRQTIHRLVTANYLERIQDWDNRHGLFSTGHLSRTEFLSLSPRLWPNELRCCKYLDIPCTDPLGFYVGLPDAAAYHTGVKVVSSAARLFGKPQCGSDALAVMGNETALRDLAYQMDFQITLGITFFNIHGLHYSLDGARKDEVPPCIFYQHSEWPLMRHLLEPMRRKCERVASGQPVHRLAVLYPDTSFNVTFTAESDPYYNKLEDAFHAFVERLLSAQKDFDFIDEATLAERTADTWRQDYDCIICFHTSHLGASAANALEAFQAKGGRVMLIGESLPSVLESLDNPSRPWTAMTAALTPELTDEALSSLPGPSLQGNCPRSIFVQRRRYPDGKVHALLFNRGRVDFVGDLDGTPVAVPAGGSCFDDDPVLPEPQNAQDVSAGWNITFPDNFLPLPFWRTNRDNVGWGVDFLARDYSAVPADGSVTYQAQFLLQGKPDHLSLLLEESSFTSPDWRILINGHEIRPADFHRQLVYDCLNQTADITRFLRSDAEMPLLNTIQVCTEGTECRLVEMPYLHGDFAGEYRHGLRSLADLWVDRSTTAYSTLPDWRSLGRGMFSGCAIYRQTLDLKAGQHLLDCGRVEDAVEFYLDGAFVAARIQPHYCFAFDCAGGLHTLELRVWNGPGNRERCSDMPAGLLGPVRLA
ncbi:MAG: hypothetical protein IJJ33_19720 [Victivallales bacterium]|nr:hypothetical protein [Victivallales bacterium]